MKLSFAIAAFLSLSIGVARADDPLPPEAKEPVVDEPGAPGENRDEQPAPDQTPAPAPTPAPTTTPTRARLSNPTPRTIRPRIKDDGGPLEKFEDKVLGGRHWRIKTAQGSVHVWVPDGYDRATAGTVVYVHGYWTDSDGAWANYDLAKQFKMSHQNALFIVPDAPSSMEDNVKWPALTDLRRAISRANIKMPEGPIVVMGHSGAFRTVMQWVDHKLVDQIILLDAMYGGEYAFEEFIKSGKRADEHKMIVVGASVAQRSADFIRRYKFAYARENVPDTMSGFTKEERKAKLLYIHSQYSHYPIVTNKKVIPLLLRVTRLKSLN